MLVLHGFWSAENGLCLWAEDSDRTVKSLWVPNWSSASCDLGVFVDQPAE